MRKLEKFEGGFRDLSEEEIKNLENPITGGKSPEEAPSRNPNEYREFELEEPDAPMIPSNPSTMFGWSDLPPQVKEKKLLEYEKQKKAREEWEMTQIKKAA